MTSKQQKFINHIKKWQDSGLTQSVYCRRHNLDIKQFGYYRRRYTDAEATRFTEVTPGRDSEMRLEFPGGITLRLSGTIDPAQLRSVCEALRC